MNRIKKNNNKKPVISKLHFFMKITNFFVNYSFLAPDQSWPPASGCGCDSYWQSWTSWEPTSRYWICCIYIIKGKRRILGRATFFAPQVRVGVRRTPVRVLVHAYIYNCLYMFSFVRNQTWHAACACNACYHSLAHLWSAKVCFAESIQPHTYLLDMAEWLNT